MLEINGVNAHAVLLCQRLAYTTDFYSVRQILLYLCFFQLPLRSINSKQSQDTHPCLLLLELLYPLLCFLLFYLKLFLLFSFFFLDEGTAATKSIKGCLLA